MINSPSFPALPVEPTAEEIRRGLGVVVTLIDNGFPELWSLFERLESDLERLTSRDEKLALYRTES